MRVNDAILGGVLVVLAAALALYARSFPAIPGQDYGAAVFPTLIAAGFGGSGLVLIVGGMRHWQGALTLAEWTGTSRAWINLATAVAVTFAVIFASPWLGFVPVVIVALVLLFMLLGTRWWIALPTALVVAVLIHQLFAVFLRIPLPRGIYDFL